VARLYAGTSGFAYPAWKPSFYPKNVAQARFLEYYATRLNSVEINYTFRRTASASTLEKWIAATPEEFQFSIKAHQRITHMRRLKAEAAEATEFFFDSLEPLRKAGRLGVVLFQLPPNLKCDLGRLRAFLPLLPEGVRCTFEFRHESWFDDQVYDLLREHGAGFCRAESETLTAPEAVTADFVYFRLRKPQYSEEDLKTIELQAGKLLAEGRSVFLYFKHEDTPEGALQAERAIAALSA